MTELQTTLGVLRKYEICEVPKYEINYLNSSKKQQDINGITAILKYDKQFHERLNKDYLLKLSVDVDKMTIHNTNASLDKIFDDICLYIGINKEDISYTTNFSVTSGSHHIVIPKFYMNTSYQKVL